MPQANFWELNCYSPQLFCRQNDCALISNTANQNLPTFVVMTDAGSFYTWGWGLNGALGIADVPPAWRQPSATLVPVP